VGVAAAQLGPRDRALVLGVTPELCALPCASLVAIDRVPAMVHGLFRARPGAAAAIGDWTALPLAAGSIDVALGDGVLSNLPYPDGYRALAAELARVLAPGGRAALRLFASPAARERLAPFRTGSFHALKWRVAMAVTPASRNVAVAAIRDAFDATFPDRAALPFARDVVDHIDAYAGSSLVYSFPTADEAVAALPGFREIARHLPGYELGDRCPTIVLARA
jgi:SAM-dependent methyltransferase